MKKRAFIFFCSFLAIFFLISSVQAAKNVIIMIGDGMGPAVIGLAKYHRKFIENKPFNMEKVMEEGVCGYMLNYSASHLVTDSAAAATAMACGVKTNNETIGMDPQGKKVENLTEIARKTGRAAGLVTTCEITDATPAGFSAHTNKRSSKEDIAAQQIESGLELLLGGGRVYFNERKDGIDLAETAAKSGYLVVSNTEELKAAKQSKKNGKLLGLFAKRTMAFSSKKSVKQPTLKEMTEKALEFLSSDPDGLFLLVEGGRIDHAGHDNNPADLVEDTIAFDDAVGAVYAFITDHPDSLLVITADHDTGGVALTKMESGSYPVVEDFKKLEGIKWVSGDHTASPLFLFAQGKEAPQFNGLRDNTDIHKILKAGLTGK